MTQNQTKPLLSDYTTFRLGGPCRDILRISTPEDLMSTIKVLNDSKSPFVVIGAGSNLLVSDAGIDCVVLRYVADALSIEQLDERRIKICGAVSLDALAQWTSEKGLSGINFCSGIPGTLAGAIVGNAGAFGKSIGDVVESVDILNKQSGKITTIPRSELHFQYRESLFKRDDSLILLSAILKLTLENHNLLLKERAYIQNLRKEKHPDWRTTPCAGSFFKNVKPTSDADRRQSAGWFLEQAGAKELNINGARTFDKHANIIIKSNETTTASDVYALSMRMTKLVEEKFNIRLEPEVRILGDF